MREERRATISVTLPELLTAAIAEGLLDYYDACYTITIPPGYTLTIVRKIPPGKISIVAEERYAVSRDGALEWFNYVDKKLRGYNLDVRQMIYNTPINWVNELRVLLPTREESKVVIRNKDTENPVDVTIKVSYGYLPRDFFNLVVKRYLEEIQRWSGWQR